jgi:membrane-associated phospholipid phosphatase
MTKDDFLMQMKLIVLVIGCAASSLTLTAISSMCAPPQAHEQRAVDAKESSSDAEANKMAPTKKIARGLELEPFESSKPGLTGLGKRFLEDQEQIWASPAKIRFSDAEWLVPVSGITAGFFVTDSDFSRHLSQNPTTISHYKSLSNAGVGALIGGAGGMWLLGHVRHNEHWSETGFLAGEAAVNSLVGVETFKYSLRRQRPYQGDGSGPFFQNAGTSFPSEHAAAAWSVAGVVAHEYPGPLMKIMAYGLASLVDYSRIRGRQHFPSDVFVGSIMGNLIAQNVYSRHHDPGLGGEAWRSISQVFRGDGNLTPGNMGSPYVPMVSWVYSAFDRVAAMGYVKSGIFGMRPWTRLECARLLSESEDQSIEGENSSEAAITYLELSKEFAGELREMSGGENRGTKVESVYARVTGISGQPLTDGFHFGETIINDYGRPFQEGLNSADGFSAWTTTGHLVAYVRGEYQHAPSAPALSESARQFIFSSNNSLPSIPPPTPFSSVNRFQLLDAYFGLNFSSWQITFGPQNLWWGPSLGGPLMFNDNATPVNMLRVNRVSPFKLPGLLSWLGPLRMEWFLGQLTGHDFVFQSNTGIVGQFGRPLNRQPFLDGARFSFKPMPDFELGFSLTTVFAGGPSPLTAHTFIQTFSAGQGNGFPGNSSDPGDRRSGLDFTFRIPGVKDGLSIYTEAFVEDEYSPIAYWRNAAIWSGLYLAQIPKLNKLDFRVEAGYTDLPGNLQTGTPDTHYAPGIFYSNGRYPNGSYTNDGNLLGNWMGRQSQGVQAWSNYRFSPRSFIQASFRHQKVSQQYMPGGGTLTDVSLSASFRLRNDLSASGSVQYERWLYPIITPGVQTNVTTSLQLVFWPQSWRK